MQRSRHMLPDLPWLPLRLDCCGPLTALHHTVHTLVLTGQGWRQATADLIPRFRSRTDDVAASCDGVARFPSFLTSLVAKSASFRW